MSDVEHLKTLSHAKQKEQMRLPGQVFGKYMYSQEEAFSVSTQYPISKQFITIF